MTKMLGLHNHSAEEFFVWPMTVEVTTLAAKAPKIWFYIQGCFF